MLRYASFPQTRKLHVHVCWKLCQPKPTTCIQVYGMSRSACTVDVQVDVQVVMEYQKSCGSILVPITGTFKCQQMHYECIIHFYCSVNCIPHRTNHQSSKVRIVVQLYKRIAVL